MRYASRVFLMIDNDMNGNSIAVQVNDLRRTFGDFVAVDNISLSSDGRDIQVFSDRMVLANLQRSGCFAVFSCLQGEQALWEDLISTRSPSLSKGHRVYVSKVFPLR